jgi:hypothetical protein
MRFLAISIASFLSISTILASPIVSRGSGLTPICTGLNTQDGGCIRCKTIYSNSPFPPHICKTSNDFLLSTDTKGFDVTGVVTEIDLKFPQVKDECDCIQECLKRPKKCANFVWKFSTPDSVTSGHRTCTLYSDFNLPAGVTIEFDLTSPNNKNINAAKIIASGNNPHVGGPVPQAFMDVNLNTTPDPDAVSG